MILKQSWGPPGFAGALLWRVCFTGCSRSWSHDLHVPAPPTTRSFVSVRNARRLQVDPGWTKFPWQDLFTQDAQVFDVACKLCEHSHWPQCVSLFACACCKVLRVLCEQDPRGTPTPAQGPKLVLLKGHSPHPGPFRTSSHPTQPHSKTHPPFAPPKSFRKTHPPYASHSQGTSAPAHKVTPRSPPKYTTRRNRYTF